MSYNVEVLADSVSPDGVRLTTLLTEYPRFIHSEMLRHRVFSHSVASSRAIPTEKQIARVRENPFVPVTFNHRVKGMGVGDALEPEDARDAREAWLDAAHDAADQAEILNNIGIDKSRANRLLEPFIWVTDIITATEWSNFFALRLDSNAQPEFQFLAGMMKAAMDQNEEEGYVRALNHGEWHLPLVTSQEVFPDGVGDDPATQADWRFWAKVSAGRCARVSFDTHERSESAEASWERSEKLTSSGHMSPFEHVAQPFWSGQWARIHRLQASEKGRLENEGVMVANHIDELLRRMEFVGNLRGWNQLRKKFENEDDFSKLAA